MTKQDLAKLGSGLADDIIEMVDVTLDGLPIPEAMQMSAKAIGCLVYKLSIQAPKDERLKVQAVLMEWIQGSVDVANKTMESKPL